jgi:hypothetical protein
MCWPCGSAVNGRFISDGRDIGPQLLIVRRVRPDVDRNIDAILTSVIHLFSHLHKTSGKHYVLGLQGTSFRTTLVTLDGPHIITTQFGNISSKISISSLQNFGHTHLFFHLLVSLQGLSSYPFWVREHLLNGPPIF